MTHAADLAALLRREAGVDCRVGGPIYVGPVSRVFRAEPRDGGEPFAVKQFLVSGSAALDPDEAAKQFDTQSRVCAVMSGQPEPERFRTPRPLALYPQAAVVTMEWIEGRAVSALLTDRRVPGAEVERAMALAGGWLRRYHRAGPEQPHAPLDTAMMLAQLDATVARATPGLAASTRFRAALALLVARAADLEREPVTHAWQHGDFKPHNVIVGAGSVHGTDIGHLHVNCTLVDVAHFLNHVDDLCLHPAGLRHALRRRRFARCFLAAYAPDLDAGARRVLAWLRLQNLLRLRLGQPGTAPGRPRRLYDRVRHAILRSAACRTLAATRERSAP